MTHFPASSPMFTVTIDGQVIDDLSLDELLDKLATFQPTDTLSMVINDALIDKMTVEALEAGTFDFKTASDVLVDKLTSLLELREALENTKGIDDTFWGFYDMAEALGEIAEEAINLALISGITGVVTGQVSL